MAPTPSGAKGLFRCSLDLLHFERTDPSMQSILLWLLGIPIPIIILVAILT